MKTKSILAILFLLAFGCAPRLAAWTDEDYSKYDYATFAKLPDALERIDMNDIDYPLLHAAIFYETNRQRALKKLQVFGHSPALEKAAKGHSDDMVTYDFFSHTSIVKGRETVVKRIAGAGIVNAACAENISEAFGIEYQAGKAVYTPKQNGGYFSYSFRGARIENHTYIGFAKALVDQWMNSPGHRANILNPAYKFLGTGASHFVKKDFFDMDYFKCTQNFASIRG